MNQRSSQLAVTSLLVLLWLAVVWTGLPDLNDALSPDSRSFLESSPVRQPLYGIWANWLHGLSTDWQTVKQIQIALFAISMTCLLASFCSTGRYGFLSALFVLVYCAGLVRFGLLDIVGTISSEGIFFSLIILSAVLLFWTLRRFRYWSAIGTVTVLLVMSQLRSAALLVVAVPVVAVPWLLFYCRARPTKRRFSIVTLAFVCGLIVLPWMLGKQPAQLTTNADRLGFVVLPRVSLLESPDALTGQLPIWNTLSASWRFSADTLSPNARSQFDGQLQEAIRYYLAERHLLPALVSSTEVEAWRSGNNYASARAVAMSWISDQWWLHTLNSSQHLLGLLTMGHLMSDTDRREVWAALNAVDPRTWHPVGMRTDYPLNQIHEPLKRHTAAVYALIRLTLFFALCLSVFSTIRLVAAIARGQEAKRADLFLTLTVCWAIAHSLPAALTVFAEYRYNTANALMLISGLGGWIALWRNKQARASSE